MAKEKIQRAFHKQVGEGGKYLTMFPDDNQRRIRIILYKLETLGLIKKTREINKKDTENKVIFYKYHWEETEKGKKLDERMRKLWKEGRYDEYFFKVEEMMNKDIK